MPDRRRRDGVDGHFSEDYLDPTAEVRLIEPLPQDAGKLFATIAAFDAIASALL